MEVGSFYKIPTTTNGKFEKICNPKVILDYGGVYNASSNTFSGVSATFSSSHVFQSATFYEFSMATLDVLRTQTITPENIGLLALSMAQDPTSGKNYGYFFGDSQSNFVWGYIDYNTLERTKIADADDFLDAVAATADGQYYGLDYLGQLYKIEKETGSLQLIGKTSLPVQYSFAACMDQINNNMLVYCVEDDQSGSSLYELNLQTAEASKVAEYPLSMMMSMYTLTPTSDKAPNAPTLELSSKEGSMTVGYSLTLPETMIDGSAITGSLAWEISVDGDVKAQGNSTAGITVTGSITLETAGMTEFCAVAKNANGESPKAYAKTYVGNGIPDAPSNVAASWADGTMTITWDAVTSASDGGYVNPEEITYMIYDIGKGKVMANGVKGTSYAFSLPAPDERTAYRYSVTALFDGKSGPITLSNEVYLGPYGAPFEVTFNSTSIFAEYGFTVLDANEDNKTWTSTASGARYPYSSANTGDDWLFTPQIKLEAGMVYEFSVNIAGSSSRYKEVFEVKYGMGNSVESMTYEILPSTTFTSVASSPKTFTASFKPAATGLYNIGIHEISPKNQGNILLKKISIGAGISPLTPDAPTNLTLESEPTGELMLNGSVTAPSLTISNDKIAGNVSLKVYRGDELITTLSAAAGAAAAFSDRVPAKGNYTYTVTAVNEGNEGKSISSQIYVGPHPARAPQNAKMTEADQPGIVTVTWDPVTEDMYGTRLDPANISYMVYEISGTRPGAPKLDSPVKTTSATFQAIDDPNKQEFKQFMVTAFNRDEESTVYSCITNTLPVGVAYKMPYKLSCKEDLEETVFGIDRSLSTIKIGFYDDSTMAELGSQDGDNGYLSMKFGKKQQWGEIFSAKIDLSKAVRPELTFYVFKLENDDANQLAVTIEQDGVQTEVYKTDLSDMKEREWNKARISLDQYKGKDIQFRMRGTCTKYMYIFLDNIRIQEMADKDIRVTGISAPESVNINETFSVSVNVANEGAETANNFTVSLYRDGEIADTKTISSLASEAQATVTFNTSISHFDADNTAATYRAEAAFSGDKDMTNNSSKDITVARKTNKHPAISDLDGVQKDDGVHLTWTPYSKPEIIAPSESTEDIEGGMCGEQALEGWTIIDVDQCGIGSFEGLTIPGIATNSPASFFVFDVKALGIEANETVTPHSGSKFLGSFPNYDYEYNDDWAISPKLPGTAQTISFYAKTYDKWLPTNFQILYTTKDSTDPADYTMISEHKEISDSWTKYEATLPEGALHFAIRHYSVWASMLMVDDITFTYAPEAVAFDLVGHDVYRNGSKINEEPVVGGEYIDASAPDGLHTYHVVAKFATGESDLSNSVSVATSGIGESLADGVKVYSAGGNIIIEGADGKATSVFSVDGKTVYTGMGDAKVAASAGVYMVTVGSRAYKLLVK
ncbi:MAG: choice-of-anchor J domain-containing protein [Clostridium sp.]|nr:choice-of-anchor J domain-containing protein [Clostridium sp.]